MDHQAFAQMLGNYGEFVGAIAVVSTLFYLAVQVRHSKDAVEANTRLLETNRSLALGQAYQTRSGHVQSIAVAQAESPYWPQMQLKVDAGGLDALSPEERLRYMQYLRTQALVFDNIHYQHGLGLIDEELYGSTFENTVRAIPAIKDAKIIGNLRPSFIAEVERLLGTND
jgi:hypothetical protein